MVDLARLQDLNFFKGKTILSFEKLHGGLCHDVHKVICNDGIVVTRAANSPHVERNELALQSELACLGLTAPVLSNSHNIVVMKYLPGAHPQPDRWIDSALVRFAEVLVQLHQFNPATTISRLDLKPYIAGYAEQNCYTKQQKQLLDKAMGTLTELYQLPPTPGLCHHDLNPLNIIIENNKIFLIDFEAAALSDIYFDLASFIIEQQIPARQQQFFLEQYFALRSDITLCQNKLKLMKAAYCVICWSWYLLKQQQDKCQHSQTEWFERQLNEYLI